MCKFELEELKTITFHQKRKKETIQSSMNSQQVIWAPSIARSNQVSLKPGRNERQEVRTSPLGLKLVKR